MEVRRGGGELEGENGVWKVGDAVISLRLSHADNEGGKKEARKAADERRDDGGNEHEAREAVRN